MAPLRMRQFGVWMTGGAFVFGAVAITSLPFVPTLYDRPPWISAAAVALLAVAALALCVFMIGLLVHGVAVETLDQRTRTRRCIHCGYDLRANTGRACAECGERQTWDHPDYC